MEIELVEHILKMEERFYGLTRKGVISLVYQLAERNGVVTRFNKEKKEAGKEWLNKFLQRHPTISLRQPEPTSLARAAGFNRQRVGKFYDLLERVITDNELTPNRIFNMDETGFTAVQRPQKVLAKKGKHQVGSITSAERGKNVTFVCCVSAVGQYVPPLIIFPRGRMNHELSQNAPLGSIAACQKRGWITTELFTMWFEHFISITKPSVAEKVLLILDGHATHTQNLAVLDRAREVGIVLLSLPPHTTHRLQPLDVSFFKPLSTYYNQVVDQWMRCNPGMPVSELKLCGFFNTAYCKAASIGNAVNGFKSTGIWPINRFVIDDHEFAPSDVTERPLPSTVAGQPSAPNPPTSNNEAAQPSTPDTPSTSNNDVAQPFTPDPPSTSNNDVAQPSMPDPPSTSNNDVAQPSTPDPPSTSNNDVAQPSTPDPLSTSNNEAAQPSTPDPPSTSNNEAAQPSTLVRTPSRRVSVEMLSPLPKRKASESEAGVGLKRRRTGIGATELTASPYKNELAQKIALKQRQEESKKLKIKKKEEVQKVKKRTVRENKRPGPKKKVSQNSHSSRPTRKPVPAKSKSKPVPVVPKQHATGSVPSTDKKSAPPRQVNYYCGGCGILYDESDGEWLRCTSCYEWWELQCSGMLGKSKQVQDKFRCTDCC